MSREAEAGGTEEEVAVQFEDNMERVNNLSSTSGGEENIVVDVEMESQKID